MTVVAMDDQIQLEKLELGAFGTNAYIIVCRQTGDSVLIDTPADAPAILGKLKGTSPRYILLTHNHFDHLGAFSQVRLEVEVPVAAHLSDAGNLPSPADMMLNNGDVVSFGKVNLEVIHTPGHTPGSLCFKVGRYLISGDTIFPGGPGKTMSPDSFRQIVKSITGKIFVLPDDTVVHPGHGDSTVLKKEKDEFAVFSSRSHAPGLCGDVLWLSS